MDSFTYGKLDARIDLGLDPDLLIVENKNQLTTRRCVHGLDSASQSLFHRRPLDDRITFVSDVRGEPELIRLDFRQTRRQRIETAETLRLVRLARAATQALGQRVG